MYIDKAKKVLEIEKQAITDLQNRIDRTFLDAIEILDNCSGRVVVTGMGKSGIIGKKIAATFASLGIPSFFLHPAEGVHGDLGMITKGDVVIAISNSGHTQELLSIIPAIKRFNLKLIGITGKMDSPLAQMSDVTLNISVKEEACPWDIVPTASTTVTLALGDALAMVLMDKKGVKKEDFAFFHPGGSIGKNLLVKVRDLMIHHEEIPLVHTNDLVNETLHEISAKKKGVAIVVDNNNALQGIITDGDIRRAIEKKINLDIAKAKDIMSINPKTIHAETLALGAIKIMEDFSITSLVIIDANNSPMGLIHLHDILRAGIV